MSCIAEFVKELRDLQYNTEIDCYGIRELNDVCKRAANTIEELSSKLHNSQMERSSMYYHGGWIPCDERLPQEDCGIYITTHEDGSVQVHSYSKTHGFTYNWDVSKPKSEVIAWMPLPEPYKEDNQ